MRYIKNGILFLLALFFVISLSRSILGYRRNVRFYNDYKNEYKQEKKRNIELQTQLVKTQDIYEFEKIVRNKLNLHKENEYILVIPEPTPTIISPTPTPLPNYQQWYDTFFYTAS